MPNTARRTNAARLINRACGQAQRRLPEAEHQLDLARRRALGGDPTGAKQLLDLAVRANAAHMELKRGSP